MSDDNVLQSRGAVKGISTQASGGAKGNGHTELSDDERALLERAAAESTCAGIIAAVESIGATCVLSAAELSICLVSSLSWGACSTVVGSACSF